MNNNLKDYKFRGGVDIGIPSSTWPFGILEIYYNKLILRDKLLGKNIEFLKDNIERIEVKRIFSIKHAIRIYSKNPKQNDLYAFYYWPNRFSKISDALKELKYL